MSSFRLSSSVGNIFVKSNDDFFAKEFAATDVVGVMSFDIVFLRLDYIASISSHIITLS